MAKAKDSFIIYYQFKEQVEELTNEEAGILFKMIFQYEVDNIEPDFSVIDKESRRLLKSMFINIKQGLNINREKYIQRCEKNKANIEKRWKKKTDNNSIRANEKTENKRGSKQYGLGYHNGKTDAKEEIREIVKEELEGYERCLK